MVRVWRTTPCMLVLAVMMTMPAHASQLTIRAVTSNSSVPLSEHQHAQASDTSLEPALGEVQGDVRAWLLSQAESDRGIFAPPPGSDPLATPAVEFGGAPPPPVAPEIQIQATRIAGADPAARPVIRAVLAEPIAAAPQRTGAIPPQRVCAWPLSCNRSSTRRLSSASSRPASAKSRHFAQTTRLNFAAFSSEIDAAATRYGVDPLFLRAVMHTESAFNPRAVSPVGAMGLMQLMPATAQRFGVANAYAATENIRGGAQYLAWLLRRFHGDHRLAAAAYNAGEGAVDRHKGIPPYRETIDYVEKVTTLLSRYEAAIHTR